MPAIKSEVLDELLSGMSSPEDLLGEGAGRLVPFDSPGPLADEIVELLTCPEALAKAQRAAERG